MRLAQHLNTDRIRHSKFFKLLIFTSISFLICSCITEVNNPFKNFNQQIVIEGGISNFPGPYEIKLSYSGDILGQEFRNRIPLSNATVSIEDSEGLKVMLREQEPGRYMTQASEIQGQVGNRYRLLIETLEGQNYSSDFHPIPSPIQITDSRVVYNQFRQSAENSKFNSTRVQQHEVILTLETENTPSFHKIETSGHEQRFILTNPSSSPPPECEAFYFGTTSDGEETINCWQNRGVIKNGIRLINTENRTEQSFEFAAVEIPFANRGRLIITAIAKSITIGEYEFWRGIQNQNNIGSDIFSPPIEQLPSNVFNDQNEKEVLVGYFSTYSATSFDICIERAEDESYFGLPIPLAGCFENCLTIWPNSTWDSPASITSCEE